MEKFIRVQHLSYKTGCRQVKIEWDFGSPNYLKNHQGLDFASQEPKSKTTTAISLSPSLPRLAM